MRAAAMKGYSSNSRIGHKFAQLRASNESALIPFIVAGDPDLECTRRLVTEFEARGADLIELGVPFSDPMADGPANQRAAARGLASGATLPAILALVAEVRKQTQIPIILFGYYNPIFHYGCERLCADARQAGVDGLLVVDLPPEEARELAQPARSEGLDLIYLLAPTTPLGSLGLDSLMGLEIRNRLEASLGLTISATLIWTYPTIAALTAHLAEKLGLALEEQSTPAIAEPSAQDELRRTAEKIAELSEAEMETLLLKKLERKGRASPA